MKNRLRFAAFIVVCIVFMCILDKVLSQKAPEYMMMDTFYNDGSHELIDVLCIGSSHAYTSCDTEVYWNEFGIPVYCISSPSQPVDVSYYYLKEALKYCKPKVMLLEGSTIHYTQSGYDYACGVAVSSVKKNLNRLSIALHSSNNLRLSLLSDVLFYHDRYKSVNQYDIDYIMGDKGHNTHGFNPWWNYGEGDDQLPIGYKTNETIEADAEAISYVEKIIELCRDNDIIPIIYISPHGIGEEDQKKMNWWRQFFQNNGITFVDGIQLVDELEIDINNDIAKGHASYYGAGKISEYIGNYLAEKGYVTDHRNDQKYIKWDEDANYYCSHIEQFDYEIYRQDFKTYISKVLQMEDVLVAVTYPGSSKTTQDDSEAVELYLKNFGISVDLDDNRPFVGLYCNDECLFESQMEKNIFEGIFNDKPVYFMSDENGENLIIDYRRLSKVNEKREDGIKVYVYSKLQGKCIDSRNFSLDEICTD